MKRVGLFLGYAPEQSIRKEGIGRLLAFLIKATLARGDVRLTIASPAWYKAELNGLLEDHRIDASQLEFVFTRQEPYLLRWRRIARRAGAIRKSLSILKPGSVASAWANRAWESLVDVAASSSLFEALPGMLRTLVNGLLAGLFALVRLSATSVMRLCQFFVPVRIRKIVEAGGRFVVPLPRLRNSRLAASVYEVVRDREFDRLIARINDMPEVDVWFAPTMFWPAIRGIRARKVVACPDIVFLDFPTRFAHSSAERTLEAIVSTAGAADHFVCYSEYVAESHLMGALGIERRRVSVLRHGRPRLDSYLSTDKGSELHRDMRVRARETLRRYAKTTGRDDALIAMCEQQAVPYAFYASQWRPHKNMLALVKAVEKINRHGCCSIRLVLTANLEVHSPLRAYIHERGLQGLVVGAHDVPSEVLASLYALARVVVNPTLFEGGFPFTFAEGFSVGTPSIMSDIPATREVIDAIVPEVANQILFDPYDLNIMSEKIEWALGNRDHLMTVEQRLYDSLPEWEAVAPHYLDAIIGTQT